MITARQLEQWLADWLERNSDGNVTDGQFYAAIEDHTECFDVDRLALDLAVALAEEGPSRA